MPRSNCRRLYSTVELIASFEELPGRWNSISCSDKGEGWTESQYCTVATRARRKASVFMTTFGQIMPCYEVPESPALPN